MVDIVGISLLQVQYVEIRSTEKTIILRLHPLLQREALHKACLLWLMWLLHDKIM